MPIMPDWYAQELPSSCVAACVRMSFSGFGLTCSEAEVRRLIGYSRLGVALRAAQANLAANGARAQYHNDWSVDDLRDAWRAGRHPIVGVERQLLGYPRAFHAVVLAKMTSHRHKCT